MNDFLSIIREQIERHGSLTVADYMTLALQHPTYGYYRRGDRLGRSGDFITAPEISQMFGEMIGLWCAEAWHRLGSPEQFVLLELGAGRGTLMQDALRATAKIKNFHAAFQLYLLESSETFKQLQQEKLLPSQPQYIDELSQLPELPILAIANEFFDALPIRQFVKQFSGWHERLVDISGDELQFITKPIDPALMKLIPPDIHDAKPGMIFEISMPSLKIMSDLAQPIVRNGGAALIVDYGYVQASGQGSLQAVSGHHYAPVLERPGEIDITAHVDFGLLRKAAQKQKAVVRNVTTQGEFLQNMGIELRAAQLKRSASPEQAKDIDSGLHRLIDAAEMGTLFKVLEIYFAAS